VIPRALQTLLARAAQLSRRGGVECQVLASYLEIYNDKLRDCGAPPGAKERELAIREDARGNIEVPGLTQQALTVRPALHTGFLRIQSGSDGVCGVSLCAVCVQTYKDFEDFFARANAQRKTSQTLLNTQSSRSHAVLMIKVQPSTTKR
jgi:hypothetical protein